MPEYDFIGLSGVQLAFPTVAVIGTRSTAVQQDINVVKLGVNYRFSANPAPVVAKY